MKDARIVISAAAMLSAWSGESAGIFGTPISRGYGWPSDGGRGRSGVPAARRAAKKRRSVRARSKK